MHGQAAQHHEGCSVGFEHCPWPPDPHYWAYPAGLDVPSVHSPASTVSESGIRPAALQLALPLGHADVLHGQSTQLAVDLTSGR